MLFRSFCFRVCNQLEYEAVPSSVFSIRPTESLNISCKVEKLQWGEMKRAACSKVPNFISVARGVLHYPEPTTTGIFGEPNPRNFCIIDWIHTVGWKLIRPICQGEGHVNLNPARRSRRLNHVLLLADVNIVLLDERQPLPLCRAQLANF